MVWLRFPVVLLACFVAQTIGSSSAAADHKPNVVFIVCDDQAWFDFGFMGSREVDTPNLDRLADEGVVFRHGYVPTSLCFPSLATMITGRFPHEHGSGVGVRTLSASPQAVREQYRKYPPLPRRLGRVGYLSLQTGKWWEGDYRLAGFTHGMTAGKPVPGSMPMERPNAAGHRHLGRLDRGMHLLSGGEGLRIGREGLGPIEKFLQSRDGKPFFLWYAPMMPHVPHDPPRRLYEKYKQRGRSESVTLYMAMCEWFDETVGELRALLKEQQADENTLIVFIVDNGFIPAKGLPGWFDQRSKTSPYDAGVRTPIILHWPGRVSPAEHDVPVHSIDLLPTVLAAAGLEIPEELPGINLLDVCDGKPVDRDAVFGANFRHKAESPKVPADSMDYRWCVAWPWKLILPRSQEHPELYNLADDPHEKRNLAEEHPDTVDELRRKIDQWWPAEAASEAAPARAQQRRGQAGADHLRAVS